MPRKSVEGIYDKVLSCAKTEFLEKGYQDASLRVIADNAGTSTGSIYRRFSDKAELFHALIFPVVEQLKQWFVERLENDTHLPSDEFKSYEKRSKSMEAELLDYIYENFDVFKIMVSCADNTDFAQLIHDLAEIESEYTVKYMDQVSRNAFETGRASIPLVHVLSSAFYFGLFEIVRHDMSKAEAATYVKQMRRFYQQGWNDIFFREEDDVD